MPLTASVYRNAEWERQKADCTNQGWSSRFEQVLVLNVDGPCDPKDYPNIPHVLIVKHSTLNTVHIKLAEHVEKRQHTMMGGNFLHTSDSRFGGACVRILEEAGIRSDRHWSLGAIAIHDRIE